ncbi:FAD-dependent oxidoreductase [Hoylesella oralis]|uniref:FAD-dependent oxidoreductase n=1 Tax=Hoylesella oralis TaxID=28134 RepID=UPI0028ECB61F|nr:FAD-dependent oxidoreductase [Hoylesella oralis]
MKHIIIGGVAGGATAAARIRRLDEHAEIVLIEKGKYISYANCGLPYYIGGTIAERDKLFVQTPEGFGRRFNIDVRVENEATSIDIASKTVKIRRTDGTEYTESYDKLLLSTGAVPVKPPLPGIDEKGIFTLRNVEDTDRIKAFMAQESINSAVIVGGGFIGLEMAENLHRAGIGVSIVEMADQVMAPVDFSIASYVHRELMDKGIKLYLGKGVERFCRQNGRLSVHLNNGESIDTDLVLLSIGVRPSTQLAAEAGIGIGECGICVNSYLETSAKDVYAVGDAIEFNHPLTGKPWLNYLAGPANRQGRIAADNMVKGNTSEYEGAIGTAIAKVFDVTVGTTGLPAKKLRQMGIDYKSSTTVSSSHAGYYPGAFQLTTKLTFDPSNGKLLGAQCVGHDGVDKRIDQLALIIKQGGTVYDLTKIEQAYAPPFSSAKDAIAIAGYVASNIINHTMPVIYWREIKNMNRADVSLIDVRTRGEFVLGTIEGAVNIPLDDLRERMNEIPKNKPVVLFCAVGLRGYLAQRILLGHGYGHVVNLSGGYKTYSLATQQISNDTEMPTDGDMPVMEPIKTMNRIKIDACGLQCPGPIMKLKETVDCIGEGQLIEITATDAGFPRDAKAWCNSTGNRFLSHTADKGYHTVVIEKRSCNAPAAMAGGNNKTLIMFSDDLDRAIATFVLANGAAATGKKVSIFFTFWGLNVIKRKHKTKVKKDLFSRMFAWMLPSDSTRLKLSQMSMMGIGDKMMRYIMRRKNIDSLEELRRKAMLNGVEFIACQMTMDMMGIRKEELLDGVSIGGVATYMERAERANVNLFI